MPRETRAVCLYRGEDFMLVDTDTQVGPGDEVVVLTHSRHLAELHERFHSSGNGDRDDDGDDDVA